MAGVIKPNTTPNIGFVRAMRGQTLLSWQNTTVKETLLYAIFMFCVRLCVYLCVSLPCSVLYVRKYINICAIS